MNRKRRFPKAQSPYPEQFGQEWLDCWSRDLMVLEEAIDEKEWEFATDVLEAMVDEVCELATE